MTKIQKGKTYRHRNLTEVDMHVVEIYAAEPEYFKLFVAWINRHHSNISYEDNVTLKVEDLNNWRMIQSV